MHLKGIPNVTINFNLTRRLLYLFTNYFNKEVVIFIRLRSKKNICFEQKLFHSETDIRRY